MDPDPNRSQRWEKLSRLYHAARARQGSDRAAFLNESCARDEALRSELASLLAYSDGFLDNPAPADAPITRQEPSLERLLGSDIGGYRLTEVIGAGGMGVVFRAVDPNQAA